MDYAWKRVSGTLNRSVPTETKQSLCRDVAHLLQNNSKFFLYAK